MKKGSLIIGGIVILIILVGVWVYLLFFGTPKNTDEVFANLGFSGNVERTDLPPDTTSEQEPVPQVQQPLKSLRQLTLRPAAGVFVPDETQPKHIRFVERGTGHIYEVDLNSGQETQVTKVTAPQVVEAYFSPDGMSVIMTSYANNTRSSNLMLLGHPTGVTDVTEIIPLPPNVDNFSFQDDKAILYTSSDANHTQGYRYHIDSKTQVELFRVPLTQVRMVWGNGLDAAYLYTKPSQYLEGFAYRVTGSTLNRLGTGERGLTYLRNNNVELRTIADLKDMRSEFTWEDGFAQTPVPFLPEKCAFVDSESKRFWCGGSILQVEPSFMELWYKGLKTSKDGLWSIDAETGDVALEADLSTQAGRDIDVQSLDTASGGFYVFFTNKIDGTVWVYDTLTAAGIDTRN